MQFKVGDKVIDGYDQTGTVTQIDPYDDDMYPIMITWDGTHTEWGETRNSYTYWGARYTWETKHNKHFIHKLSMLPDTNELQKYTSEYNQKYQQYLSGDITLEYWHRYCVDLLLVIMNSCK